MSCAAAGFRYHRFFNCSARLRKKLRRQDHRRRWCGLWFHADSRSWIVIPCHDTRTRQYQIQPGSVLVALLEARSIFDAVQQGRKIAGKA